MPMVYESGFGIFKQSRNNPDKIEMVRQTERMKLAVRCSRMATVLMEKWT